jgi:hypothetical protein
MNDPTFLSQCLALGLIEPDQVASWADGQIAATDQPPYWLIQLSTQSDGDPLAVQKLLAEAGAAPQVDDDSYLSLVAGLYSARADANRAVGLLYERFCIDWEEMTDLRQEIFVIEDEMGWNESKGNGRLKRLLKKHLSEFTEQAERLGLKHNQVAGGISPPAPTTPGKRVRTRRFPEVTEP